jgi:hypothetical protein
MDVALIAPIPRQLGEIGLGVGEGYRAFPGDVQASAASTSFAMRRHRRRHR